MKVYVTPAGRVFHSTMDCEALLAYDPEEREVPNGTRLLNINRRLIGRCRRCFLNVEPRKQEVITIREAADVMGISSSQAKKLAAAGNFPGAFRLSSGKTSWWRVSVPALQSFLEEPVSG